MNGAQFTISGVDMATFATNVTPEPTWPTPHVPKPKRSTMKRPMRLEIYRSSDLRDPYHAKPTWRWRIRATNGRILADSGEAYGRLRDCAKGAGLVVGFHVPAKAGDYIRLRDALADNWRVTVEK